MSIKVLPEPDVYVSKAELERLQYEYRQAMSYRSGPIPSFETWVKQRKRGDWRFVAMKWKLTDKTPPKVGETVLCWWGPAHPSKSFGVATYASFGYWHNPEDDEDDYRTPEYWTQLPDAPSAASHQEPTKEKT